MERSQQPTNLTSEEKGMQSYSLDLGDNLDLGSSTFFGDPKTLEDGKEASKNDLEETAQILNRVIEITKKLIPRKGNGALIHRALGTAATVIAEIKNQDIADNEIIDHLNEAKRNLKLSIADVLHSTRFHHARRMLDTGLVITIIGVTPQLQPIKDALHLSNTFYTNHLNDLIYVMRNIYLAQGASQIDRLFDHPDWRRKVGKFLNNPLAVGATSVALGSLYEVSQFLGKNGILFTSKHGGGFDPVDFQMIASGAVLAALIWRAFEYPRKKEQAEIQNELNEMSDKLKNDRKPIL